MAQATLEKFRHRKALAVGIVRVLARQQTPPSNTRLLLEIQDQRAARVRTEQALATASRNANVGAAGVLLSVLVFWFSSWYLLAILLFIGGLIMWISGASGRGDARKKLAEIDGKIEGLKQQVQ